MAKNKGKDEDKKPTEIKEVWLARNLETKKSGLYVKSGNKFDKLGNAKGKDKDN